MAKEKMFFMFGGIMLVVCLGISQQMVDYSRQKTISAGYLREDKEILDKDFAYYKSINEDIVLLIHLADRSIPVMKNDNYFKKDIYGDYDSLGTAYIDKISITNNMIVQGHSSANNDLMFTSLKNYLVKDYFSENKIIAVETVDSFTRYELIAIMSVNLEDEEPYLSWYDTNYRNDSEMLKYIDEFKDKATHINSDVDVSAKDKLITLVTCDRKYDDGRIVILTKKIENINSGQIAPKKGVMMLYY